MSHLLEPSFRVVVADDEPLALLRLSRTLVAAGCSILAEFQDGATLSAWLQNHPLPDALFLDVKMPGATGLDILADVGRQVPVVLVTGNPEFAVAAFDFAAVDFLTKPVNPLRLGLSLQRVKEWQEARQIKEPPRPLRTPLVNRIPVKAGDGTVLLEISKVGHFEVVEDVVWVWSGGLRFKSSWRTLTEVEAALSGTRLVRINRNLMVRPEAVRGLRTLPSGRRSVRMADGAELEASRRGTHQLQEVLGME